MDRKLFSVVLLALFSSTLANHSTTTPCESTTTGSTTQPPASGGPGSPAGGSTLPPQPVWLLSPAQEKNICNVTGSDPLCPSVGHNDSICCTLASAANGSNPHCVANNVCAFTVVSANNSANGTTGNTTTTPSTTAVHNTTIGSPLTPINPEPNTVYISCDPIPNNTMSIKVCPNSKRTFVYPCSSNGTAGNSTSSTPSTTTSSPGSGNTTTECETTS